MQKMYLLLAISNRQEEQEFLDMFTRHGVRRVYSIPCRGTVLAKTRALLGLESTEKTAHFTLLTRNLADTVMHALTYEIGIDLPQRGIAILSPLTSISGSAALSLFADGHENDDMMKEPLPMETDKELIVIVCENGHTEDVMQIARSAGAGGGTVIHAKGTGTAMAQKFYGMTLAEEKEMIFIVTKTEHKKDIMRAISESAGLSTPSRAISFSLPVSQTAGLRFFEE
jgi:nitrogen regulatory protein PII